MSAEKGFCSVSSAAEFVAARERASRELAGTGGIGTLSEKLLHKTLKFYIDPNSEHHEVEYLGAVADVKNEQGIFEIQTRAFSYLIPKLRRFLEAERVTVIYPIISAKTIYWVDSETGSVGAPHKTTRTGRVTDVLYEASALAELIPHENLTVTVMLIKADEYKRLDGWDATRKKGATRLERVPTELEAVTELRTAQDYARILPPLPESFTAKDFSRALRLRGRRASYSLKLLRTLGVVLQIGKKGNAFIDTLNI